jgi:hypothetical protein
LEEVISEEEERKFDAEITMKDFPEEENEEWDDSDESDELDEEDSSDE